MDVTDSGLLMSFSCRVGEGEADGLFVGVCDLEMDFVAEIVRLLDREELIKVTEAEDEKEMDRVWEGEWDEEGLWDGLCVSMALFDGVCDVVGERESDRDGEGECEELLDIDGEWEIERDPDADREGWGSFDCDLDGLLLPWAECVVEKEMEEVGKAEFDRDCEGLDDPLPVTDALSEGVNEGLRVVVLEKLMVGELVIEKLIETEREMVALGLAVWDTNKNELTTYLANRRRSSSLSSSW